ncbi:MAG: HlyD family secretion protein [Chitinophagia bacterium]|jgi:membrane fusion protein (multidrug efflux system)|nr:HlyD family secretion protein [Chitinophagia bacterium]NCA30238.1 HlyD family secretion protein [Chitinophagia bacterium]NDD15742.1 HlyD family secretion protein [Chitinophagia bacterium]
MEEQKKKKQANIRKVVISTLLVVALYFGGKKVIFSLTHETTDNAQIETSIVPVLTRISGYVKTISIKDYDSVGQNQLVAEIDDAELQMQLEEQKADLQQSLADVSNAQAQLENGILALKNNKGIIDLKIIKQKKSNNDLTRDQNLFKEQAITRKQLEETEFQLSSSTQELSNAQTELATANNRIAVLRQNVNRAMALIDMKKTKIKETELKLSYTKIITPSAGKIGKKSINIGQFVQAGTPLFSIVNDSTYWIVANFKESQLESLQEGKKVNIRLDAFADLAIEGTIVSLSDATGAKFSLLPPDNSSGNFIKVTQRIPVKIAINNQAAFKNKLRAGMSVFITVDK